MPVMRFFNFFINARWTFQRACTQPDSGALMEKPSSGMALHGKDFRSSRLHAHPYLK